MHEKIARTRRIEINDVLEGNIYLTKKINQVESIKQLCMKTKPWGTKEGGTATCTEIKIVI
jgi:hypothetical protein